MNKKISNFLHCPAVPGVLGLFNLALSNGNHWMIITGIALVAIAAMDFFDL